MHVRGDEAGLRGHRRQWRRWRTWLGIWLASRLAVGAVVCVGALVGRVDEGLRASDPMTWWLYRFAHWDSHLYAAIAERGYAAHGPASTYNAFFPGMPAIMRAWTSATGTNGRWGALLVVLLSGAVAAVLMGTLATELSGRREVGTLAVVLLACTPLTIFFSVAYTEAIFLCLSLAAWLTAHRHRWGWAGLLAAGSCTLRVNGLFLVAALMVMYVVVERPTRLRDVRASTATLAVGPALVLGWAAWLHHLTGQWTAWTSAQDQGWGRHLEWPWVALGDTIRLLTEGASWQLQLSRALDLVAVVVAVAAPVVFAVRRNWPVATLLLLNAVPIVFSSIVTSGLRYVTVWFPLYVLLSTWLADRPIARRVAVTASSALALTLAYCWSQQYWVA